MVLKRFLSSRLNPKPAVHSVPPGQRVYAVGDIHGRLDLLEELLEIIDADHSGRAPSEKLLIFLGDLVDRGPDSCGVIERLRRLRAGGEKVRFLLGNHDEVFLKAASGDAKATRFLVRIGGRDTILSYGLSIEDYEQATYSDLAQLLKEKVPESHREFLATFEDYAEVGDYLFVHAGIRPGLDLASQSTIDLRWIRRDFLEHKDPHERMVIHGHSISEDPVVRRNRIGIDTGAFASGRLSAIGLEGTGHWFLSTAGAVDERWQQMTD
jgi:serine/threonine protein phosphatase 1